MDAARHRDPADHRDDRRAHVQRGVLHRRAHPGREPGRRGERGLVAGQGHARQRAGVAVERRRAVGHGPDGRATCSTSCARQGGVDRSRAAPAARPALHRVARSCASSACAPSAPAIKGEQPGPEASIRKVLADEHGQQIMGLAKDLAGAGRHAHRRRPARRRRSTAGTTASCSPRRSRSAAAPARCSATSSPSGCSACPTTSTSRPARRGRQPAAPAARAHANSTQ